MRPAFAVLDAIGRRRIAPVVAVGVRQVAIGKERDQDGADLHSRSLVLVQRDEACLLNQRAVASVTSPFQGVPGGFLPRFVVQAAVGLNAPESSAEERNQL